MRGSRGNDFLVGLVVIASAIAIVVATLWVTQADVTGRRERVHARFQDVGNAQIGGAVVVRGVRAGRIETMELADDGWVRVGMSVDRDVQLPADAVVLLGESSLFGEWQASVIERSAMPADDEVQRQVAASSGAPGVLPGATMPDIARLTAVAGRLASDVATVADRVELAFDDTAAAQLRGSIRDFAATSATLAATTQRQSRNLDVLAEELRVGLAAVNRTAATVERVARRVDSSTATGEVAKVVDDVGATAVSLREASADLQRLSARLGRSQARLDELLAHSASLAGKLDRGEGSLGLLVNDPTLYQRSDSLLQALQALVADVRANPRRYVSLRVF